MSAPYPLKGVLNSYMSGMPTAQRTPHTSNRLCDPRLPEGRFAVKNGCYIEITISELLSVLKVPVLTCIVPFIEES